MKKTSGDIREPHLHTKFHENRSSRLGCGFDHIQTDTHTHTHIRAHKLLLDPSNNPAILDPAEGVDIRPYKSSLLLSISYQATISHSHWCNLKFGHMYFYVYCLIRYVSRY